MSKQTAMRQLLTQLKEERTKLPLPIEWDRCYQAIEMTIQHTYLAIEREEMLQFAKRTVSSAMNEDINNPYNLEQLYNERYTGENN